MSIAVDRLTIARGRCGSAAGAATIAGTAGTYDPNAQPDNYPGFGDGDNGTLPPAL